MMVIATFRVVPSPSPSGDDGRRGDRGVPQLSRHEGKSERVDAEPGTSLPALSLPSCAQARTRIGSGLTPAKRGHRLPVVLSVSEVRSVLSRMRGVPRLCASLMYGSGLRLAECTSLRVKDIDFDRNEILVRSSKGDKNRRVPLPKLASLALRVQIERARAQFERDSRTGVMGSLFQVRLSGRFRVRSVTGAGSSCFRRPGFIRTPKPVSASVTISMSRSSSGRLARRCVRVACPSAHRRTRCVIRSQRIFSNREQIFARFRN
jgi:integrase